MALTKLDSEDIAHLVFSIATPETLCSILRTNNNIVTVRRYLFENSDNAQRDIEEFVRERLIDLKSKVYFSHEPAFCALAVALETMPMRSAEDFLSELAALKIAEMPLSSRVAAICIQRRRELITSYTLKEFNIAPLKSLDASPTIRLAKVPTGSTYPDRRPKVQTESTYPEIFKVAA